MSVNVGIHGVRSVKIEPTTSLDCGSDSTRIDFFCGHEQPYINLFSHPCGTLGPMLAAAFREWLAWYESQEGKA